MNRTFRTTSIMAAALAALAPIGMAQAQEANAWDIAPIVGRADASADAPLSRAALTREQVRADLDQARRDGTFHAGGEGPTPDVVLQSRMAANQREGERIARAYRDEAHRIARVNAQRQTTPDAAAEATPSPVAATEPSQAVAPPEHSTASPAPGLESHSTMPSTASPAPVDSAGTPMPSPDGDRGPGAPPPQPDAAVNSRGSSGVEPRTDRAPAPNPPTDTPAAPDASTAPALPRSSDTAPAESSPVQSSPMNDGRPLPSDAQPPSDVRPPALEGASPPAAPSESTEAPTSLRPGRQQEPAAAGQPTPAR